MQRRRRTGRFPQGASPARASLRSCRRAGLRQQDDPVVLQQLGPADIRAGPVFAQGHQPLCVFELRLRQDMETPFEINEFHRVSRRRGSGRAVMEDRDRSTASGRASNPPARLPPGVAADPCSVARRSESLKEPGSTMAAGRWHGRPKGAETKGGGRRDLRSDPGDPHRAAAGRCPRIRVACPARNQRRAIEAAARYPGHGRPARHRHKTRSREPRVREGDRLQAQREPRVLFVTS